MKRKNNLYNKILNTNNLIFAHSRASKGKLEYTEVKKINENLNKYIFELNKSLINKSHKTSNYKIDTRIERGKERVIYKLPYFPDRVLHHALLQVVQPILETAYIKDTYQSIKGRGIHKAKKRVESFLEDRENTVYCLKIDIKKYYPNVNNEILKSLIRKKIKCKDTLFLIDEIIDSTEGLPIGNYTSQTFGNFYLSYFDHWIKEDRKIKYYVRYADDMIFLHRDKDFLHKLNEEMQQYLLENLKLTLKENHQVFEIKSRGIDFLGFKFYHTYTLIRGSIKKAYLKKIREITKNRIKKEHINSIMSYYGWLKAGNGYNLLRSTISDKISCRVEYFCKKSGLKNPFRKIFISVKKVNRFGRFQPTLF
jgi:RNA-directed DNA polymerase